MKRYLIALVLTTIVCLAGCRNISTCVHITDGVDFSKLRSYTWAQQGDPAGNDPRIDIDFLEPRIMASFDAELAAKGYKKKAKGAAFLLGYSVAIAERKVVYGKDEKEAHIGSGFSRKGRYDWQWTPEEEAELEYYDEGTLCIRVVSPKDGSILWQACASMPVELAAENKEREKMISIIIKELMAEFPE